MKAKKESKYVHRLTVNSLTGLRILLVPFFIISEFNNAYLTLFFIALSILISDILDGMLARIWKIESFSGALLDLAADFIAVFSIFLIFYLEKTVPLILIIIIFMAFSIYTLNCFLKKGIVFTKFGKAAGLICMISIALICLIRILLISYYPVASIIISYFCVFYLGLTIIENVIMIGRNRR